MGKSAVNRRLIIRPGAIGDFLVSLPALEYLRVDYTEVWCASANVPLARFADRAVSIASSGLDRLGVTHAEDVIERLRSFDSIVSWYGTNRPEFRNLARSLHLPIIFHRALPPEGASMHAGDFYLAQAGAPPGVYPQLFPERLPREDFAVIHPFSGSGRKNWPLDRFRELARRIAPAHFCRGPEDDLPDAVYIPDLYDLARWLSSARVFVGNDSGIAHLAAAAGTPVVALFGPTDSAVWAPRGPAVTVLSRRSLADITVDEVWRSGHSWLPPAF